ncbi:MAG: hypothetical protein SW833_04245 [Cyanobacteriota bacterium]|nr:hypothetical protein [Cyanobacteriota bacterium]
MSCRARSQLAAFRRKYPRVPAIFTTRDLSLGGDFGIEKKLEMQLSDRQLWGKALKHLAWVMMGGEKPVELQVAIRRQEAERELEKRFEKEPSPPKTTRDCLDDLLKYHLLQIKTGNEIEFRHQLIQEYYAAEALLGRLGDLSDGELKREYLNYLKWTEPVALMLALVGDEVQAVRVVRLAMIVVSDTSLTKPKIAYEQQYFQH